MSKKTLKKVLKKQRQQFGTNLKNGLKDKKTIKILIGCIAFYLLAFCYFNNATDSNTRIITSTISNLKLERTWFSKSTTRWASFSTSGGKCYYVLSEKQDYYDVLESIERNNKEVKFRVTGKTPVSLLFDASDRLQVVEVFDNDTVYVPISFYNFSQSGRRFFFAGLASILLITMAADAIPYDFRYELRSYFQYREHQKKKAFHKKDGSNKVGRSKMIGPLKILLLTTNIIFFVLVLVFGIIGVICELFGPVNYEKMLEKLKISWNFERIWLYMFTCSIISVIIYKIRKELLDI